MASGRGEGTCKGPEAGTDLRAFEEPKEAGEGGRRGWEEMALHSRRVRSCRVLAATARRSKRQPDGDTSEEPQVP